MTCFLGTYKLEMTKIGSSCQTSRRSVLHICICFSSKQSSFFSLYVFLQGILNVVEKCAPEAEHRNCARHIYANWKKDFHKKEWQKPLWACAKAPCKILFNLARARLAQHTPALEHWSRAWFRLGSNYDSVDNNLCESFNKCIVEARFFSNHHHVKRH